uniref:DUF1549 domain-containing protein n=1 Tax=Schlesneria paludicola TaxID=360056 RepID=A0A7C2NYY1_9PLAN
MSRPVVWLTISLTLASGALRAESPASFRVEPAQVELRGNFAQAQLLVPATAAAPDHAADLTTTATYASANEQIVTVTPAGRLIPRGDGTATVTVSVNGQTVEVPVTVSGVAAQPTVDFLDQVRPVLTKQGCALGACHAAQYGQGGFKLSVFGFDPAADHAAMTRDSLGRRINPLDPTQSLILRKPTMQTPHGGGRRLQAGSRDYEMLVAWLAGGAPKPAAKERAISQLVVTPSQRVTEPGQKQQLRVVAHYADGEVRDVTAWARFDSLDDGLIIVNSEGVCTVVGRGQAAVMVRFEGQAGICTFLSPYSTQVELAGWTNQNFIDELAVAKFRELGIEPSPLCDDHTFLRRIFLDATGTLPTAEEIAEFIADPSPNKRQLWIDRLLGFAESPRSGLYNERYAAYWTLKWSDLLRNNSRDLQDQGMWAFHNWIKEQFRANVSYDRFVQQLVQGKGSVYSNGPANYFLVSSNPNEMAESTAQLFLGARLQCAQCHHHPFEKYSQDDYYGFAAFFARVGIKNSQEFGLFGGERVIVAKTTGEVRQPRSGQTMAPKPLDAEPADHPLDRRIPLATWMTSPQNPAFAQAVVNRYVSYLLGRGLVEPVDDIRATNPPTNVALMQALSDDFVQHQFNLKHLVRTILSSRLYQLDSQPTSQNVADTRFYSHFLVKRLAAEPLLDAIDHAAGTQTKFKDLPPGTRAIEIPDAEYPDFFLNTFAKPRRVSVCECERAPDPNLAQALHTLNGDVISGKIADKQGRVAKLLADKKPHAEIVTDLYLATLGRPATADETASAERLLADYPNPKEGYEDLLWALINSKGFLFVR